MWAKATQLSRRENFGSDDPSSDVLGGPGSKKRKLAQLERALEQWVWSSCRYRLCLEIHVALRFASLASRVPITNRRDEDGVRWIPGNRDRNEIRAQQISSQGTIPQWNSELSFCPDGFCHSYSILPCPGLEQSWVNPRTPTSRTSPIDPSRADRLPDYLYLSPLKNYSRRDGLPRHHSSCLLHTSGSHQLTRVNDMRNRD
jgi:hypothetical protein